MILPRTVSFMIAAQIQTQRSLACLRSVILIFAIVLVATNVEAQVQKTAPTCADKINAVLADIKRLDFDTSEGPPRNAFLTLNPVAIAEAKTLDRDVANGRTKGPLFCLPLAVKDAFATVDMPTTVGSLSLVGNWPPNDAALVARLRRAGAIVIGKTNLDEFALGVRGISGAGGRVGNAYDPWQSAGGSSSGSGVAVGFGFVPLAVASDSCGSLRITAVYNGALTLRPTYGRLDSDGMFPIAYATSTPGLIAKDTQMLRAGLAVIADDWRVENANAASALKGKRLGLVRSLHKQKLWAAGDADTRVRFESGIALLRRLGASIENVNLDGFDVRLGPEFIVGFGPRVDAMLARYPGPKRKWRDVCVSGRILPEWSLQQCLRYAASDPKLERQVMRRIDKNRRYITALLDRLHLDALVYPMDGRGGARADPSANVPCPISANSGTPTVAFPIGLDRRGLPLGLELLGRPGSDEDLVAMMAHFESARGLLRPPHRPPGRDDLNALSIPEFNNLHLMLGWRMFQSRRGKDLGAARPGPFRALTDEVIRSWRADGRPTPER
jgi:Asp-tRNA(Asn)/Glu-tRNA(Gln) amidotransferase A subunit family amidase